jgi:pimeloyl-ACP methyl ester carboxylesterase
MAPTAKPTLVLLPGLMCDAAVWSPQVEALRDRFDCIVIDYGALDSLQAMAEHVLATVAATADAARFALAGHSMGGRVAFEVMRLAPERVTHLALMDTATNPLAAGDAGAKERAGRLELLEIAQRDGMRAMGRRWAVPMVHPAHVDTPVFDAIVEMIARRTPALFEAQIRALLTRPDASALLAHITCPTLVLCGREDAWNPPAGHELMRDALRNAAGGARLVVVPHSGHMVTMEQPDAVNRAMRDWLA